MLELLLLPQATIGLTLHSISQTIMPRSCHVLFSLDFGELKCFSLQLKTFIVPIGEQLQSLLKYRF